MLKQIRGLRFSGISDDSRTVKKGDIFFAISGSKVNGNKFINEAINKGAVAIVTDEDLSADLKSRRDVSIIQVPDSRIALAQLASEFYNIPTEKLKVIGITGTNGKTTVSYLLRAIFKKAGSETGIIGTISYRWKDKVIEASNTTPGTLQLQRLLHMMVEDSVKYCAMEVSSHSLDQDRVFGIDFDAALFTNITSEHLDYHKTFENYLEAKAKLFKRLKQDRLAVLNLDDENFSRLKKGVKARILTYGVKNDADVRAEKISMDSKKTEFLIRTKRGAFQLVSPLIGIFNVYNILAGICYCLEEGVPVEIIKEAVLDFRGAEGRLEAVESKKNFKIFIDYAHTDDALKNVLSALRDVVKNRLILVFGCGGDRDRLKRPRMGSVASRLADYVVITSDNPRSEDPLSIAKEVENGIAGNFKDYEIILDRFEAIKKTIEIADSGDIVLIAGKGHEKYQIVGNELLPFSDRETVQKILSETGKGLKV